MFQTLCAILLCALPAPVPDPAGIARLDTFSEESCAQWYDTSSAQMPLTPTADGLRIDADFIAKPEAQRISVDRTLKFDFSCWNRFEVDMNVENPAAFGTSSLYFRSGNGWYSCSGNIPNQSGTLTFDKTDFSTEGEPAGWDKIDAVRISFWKLNEQKAAVTLREFRTVQEPILFVSFYNGEGIELWLGRQNTAILTGFMRDVGLKADKTVVWDGLSPEEWAPILKNRRIVILNYTFYMQPATRTKLEKWASENGTQVLFIDRSLEKEPMSMEEFYQLLAQDTEIRGRMEKNARIYASTVLGEVVPNAKKIEKRTVGVFEKDGFAAGVAFCRRAHEENLKAAALEVGKSENLKFRAWWNHSGLGAYPGDWPRTAKELKAAGFTAVIPNMLWANMALYPSDYLPPGDNFRKYGDQMKACVDACHAEGIEVHVWKVNFNFQYHHTPEFFEKMQRAGRVQITANGEPKAWYCPSNPENIELECASMLELIEKYDVDGIHFDYIRFPGGDTCYCDGCRKRFEAALGSEVQNWPKDVLIHGPLHQEFRAWRATCITALVKKVHGAAKRLNPKAKISAAVFSAYPGCRDDVGQDWALWAREGYVDFLCPMNYTQNAETFTRLTKRQQELLPAGFPFYPGIGQWRLDRDGVVEQVREADRLGCSGFTIFDLGKTSAEAILPLWTK